MIDRTNLLLVITSTILALLLAEAIVRIAGRELPVETWGRQAFCRDPEGLRIMRPGVSVRQFSGEFDVRVAANSMGYRDTEWGSEGGPFRILVLGDSFGWGWGVPADSMMVRGIERIPGVEAYNLSIPGDDLVTMYRRYRTYRDLIDPDLVVVLNFINDFFDVEGQRKRLEALDERFADPRPSTTCASFSERGFRDWLNASRLYRLVNRFRLQRGIRILPRAHHRNLFRHWYEPDFRLLSSPEALREATTFYADVLERIRRDHEVVVVGVPPGYRFDPAQRARLVEAIEGWEHVDPDALDVALASMGAATGVEYLSLVDTLARAGRSDSPYFERDGHMRGWAQALVGRHLEDVLRGRVRELASVADSTGDASGGR